MESMSSLLDEDDSVEDSEAEELVGELVGERVVVWVMREGVMGVGEPMSVGELVAVDGCDSVGA